MLLLLEDYSEQSLGGKASHFMFLNPVQPSY